MGRDAGTTVLERILTSKREEIAAHRRDRSEAALRTAPGWAEPRRGFARALATHAGRTIIAEVKRASPSRGILRADIDAAVLARTYAAAGAAAVSVLTDGPFFRGSLADLAAARGATSLPLLRKDFVIDPYQVSEARAAGADAILVIIAATTAAQRLELAAAAREVEVDVLVEVHDEKELETALGEGAGLVGINNRDLRTFVTSLTTSERLLPRIPRSIVTVCESGLGEAAQMARLEALGARAFLVGETLIAADDPGAKLRALLGA
jgi:indole-3-glycerol phosphate synthase